MITKALLDTIHDDLVRAPKFEYWLIYWSTWEAVRGFKWTLLEMRSSAVNHSSDWRASLVGVYEACARGETFRSHAILVGLEYALSEDCNLSIIFSSLPRTVMRLSLHV
jgi:hypothetical protein